MLPIAWARLPRDDGVSARRVKRSEGDTVNDKNAYPDDRGLFAWLGRAVVAHPWRVIALWVVAAAAVIMTAPGLPTTSNESSFLPKNYESIRAMDLQDKAFPQSGHVTSAAAIIVFSRADGGKLTGADSAKVTAIATDLNARHIHDIVSITAGPATRSRHCGQRLSR